jgi:hypothetical protein
MPFYQRDSSGMVKPYVRDPLLRKYPARIMREVFGGNAVSEPWAAVSDPFRPSFIPILLFRGFRFCGILKNETSV